VVTDMLHVSWLAPPAGNILISNLPGSPVKLYLRGARLEEVFPISTIPPDMVMNITVFSYAGDMFFGMIAGYEAMPHLPEMRRYIHEAIEALEHEVAEVLHSAPEPDPAAATGPGGAVAGPAPAKPVPRSTRPRKAAPRKKPTAKKTGAKKAATKKVAAKKAGAKKVAAKKAR